MLQHSSLAILQLTAVTAQARKKPLRSWHTCVLVTYTLQNNRCLAPTTPVELELVQPIVQVAEQKILSRNIPWGHLSPSYWHLSSQ
jgi:hypothetical protein